jgi:mono/diheme cytochrome c family protein
MKNIIYSFITVILLTSPFVMLPASSADTGNKENKTVTFTRDVAPIFFKNCAECHGVGVAGLLYNFSVVPR